MGAGGIRVKLRKHDKLTICVGKQATKGACNVPKNISRADSNEGLNSIFSAVFPLLSPLPRLDSTQCK